ncbi:uncharacterized protein LOC122833255 isoform X2 [Gambusia affinis]|uniref:uncharacterized protein LOC122833255 isoform X2 n=1 Tax=Gambusia affinis TaxID=33528 RepID=UPI001CDC9DA5|nr:uncharacterized protein LOC122833255 isoform X2 [Gambusia affinis]
MRSWQFPKNGRSALLHICNPVKTDECVNGSTVSTPFCCEGTTYDPRNDTCCGHDGNKAGILTEGLSERMSQCCGEKAYNPLNEICCNQTVKPKPSHNPKCCGTVPYDERNNVCCSNKLLKKRSPKHQCCYGKLFDSTIENCCQNKFPRIQMKINRSLGCEKNLPSDPTMFGNNTSEYLGADNQINEINKSDKTNASSTLEVCGTGDETEWYHKKEGFQCCGHHYINTTLWYCDKDKLHAKFNV